MKEIIFSCAGLDDVEELADLRVGFLIELRGRQTEGNIHTLRQNLQRYFRNAINSRTYYCWLARADNKIVGVGGMAIRENPGNFLNLDGKQGYIMNMYTHPQYRKQGIGSAILKNLMASGKVD